MGQHGMLPHVEFQRVDLVVTSFAHFAVSCFLCVCQCLLDGDVTSQSRSHLLANGGTNCLKLGNRGELNTNVG
jgi:hypothetical protein